MSEFGCLKCDEKAFDEFMNPTPVFIADGKTYPHREEFTSWGWIWDYQNRYWKLEGSTENDLAVKAIMKIDGVNVRIELGA